MEKIFSRIKRTELSVKNIDAYSMEFNNHDRVDYLNSGRKKHLLHLILSGERVYKTKDSFLRLQSNSLLLIPNGTKYASEAKTVNNIKCSGIGIGFDCESLFCDDELDIFYKADCRHFEKIRDMFFDVYKSYCDSAQDLLSVKADFYKLLSYLCNYVEEKSVKFTAIMPAIEFISDNYQYNLPVREYAKKCNLSESYFRKIFTEYMGISPLEYRNKLRFAEAIKLYRHGLSAQEIAEKVGFCDGGNLMRNYKKCNGISLKAEAQII